MTLTPEAKALVKAAVNDSDRSFKDVINDAIVTALAPRHSAPFRTKSRSLGRFDPGRAGLELPPEKILAIAATMEDRELARLRDSGK